MVNGTQETILKVKIKTLEEKVERYEKALKDIDMIIDASHYSPRLHLISEKVCEALKK